MTQNKNHPPAPEPPEPNGASPRRGKRPQRPVLGSQGVSRDARRTAAAILEVLAGVRTPTEAAVVLGMSVPRYYLWEQRALTALVAGCEPRPPGQTTSLRHQVVKLQKEVARLKQECARQQALVRATQRTIGLTPPPAKTTEKVGGKTTGKATGKGKKPRQRRPAVRALKAVAALEAMPAEDWTLTPSPGTSLTGVVQRSAGDLPTPAAVSAEAAPAAAET
jgi:hypothetical protein